MSGRQTPNGPTSDDSTGSPSPTGRSTDRRDVVVVVGGRSRTASGRPPRRPPRPAGERAGHRPLPPLEGSVKVKPVGTFEWVSADPSMVLRKSDLVRTGPGAAAEIAFFDGTVVHVRPDSLITIEETSEDPSTKRRKVAWHISSGEVNFQTVRRNVPGSAAEISTPTVRTTASGQTAGGIRVAQSGDSDVRIFRGSAEVETAHRRAADAGRHGGAWTSTPPARPRPRRTLPGVPALLAPPHQAEITYADPDPRHHPADLEGGAGRRRLPRDARLQRVLQPAPRRSRRHRETLPVQLRGLDTGKYYWRVAAVGQGRRGRRLLRLRALHGGPARRAGRGRGARRRRWRSRRWRCARTSCRSRAGPRPGPRSP